MKISSKNKGIALIQVLIISIILTMLGIYINQTVRSQVKIVGVMKSAFELNVIVENTQAELMHILLTNKHYTQLNNNIALVQQWNFYNKPYTFSENVIIKVQDLTGLISLNNTDNKLTRAMLLQLGQQESKIRMFLDSLKDWKDSDALKRLNGAEKNHYQYLGLQGPRNGFLQTISEVLNIKNGDMLPLAKWKKYFSLAVVSNFNPLNAPQLLLKAFIDDDDAFQKVLSLRKEGKLNELSFYQATAIDSDEFISFATGRILKITITANKQKNKLSKQFIVDLRTRSPTRPVIINNITWNTQ